MDNEQTHQCADFTRSVAAEFDRLWAAVGDHHRLLQDHLEFQQRQNDLVAVQIELVRDEIDDLADWLGERFEQRLDAAVGEAAIARIETDRIQERLTEVVDQLNLRIAEVEVHLASASADVGAAAQTERLDELERAIDELGAVRSGPNGSLNGAPNGSLNGALNGAQVPAPPPRPLSNAVAPIEVAAQCEQSADDTAVIDSMARLMETLHQPVSVSSSNRGHD